MKRNTIIIFIMYTSLSAAAQAASPASNQLMFVGSVVRPQCITSNTGPTLTLSCLNDVALGREIERYDVASLARMHTLRSKYKKIAVSSVDRKPGLARVTVAYD